MPRHFARPHIGKVPMKFYFRAQDIQILLPGVDTQSKLVVVWKRGPRRTTTGAIDVVESLSSVDGSLSRVARTSQDLALICTMFKNSKTGGFEPKSAAFTIAEETAGGEEKKLGTCMIDLAAYATPEASTDPVELSFLEGKMVLKFTLSSHWLKNMKGGDDDDDAGSVSSYASFASDAVPEASFSVAGGEASLSSLATFPAGAPPPGHRRTGSGGAPSSSSSGAAGGFAPLSAAEKAQSAAQREAAIEQRWAEEEAATGKRAEAEGLREELRQALDKLARAREEAKYHKENASRLTVENRVLRKEQRSGKRDEVVLQLEVELARCEEERATMEENLSQSFNTVIKELVASVASLQEQKRDLLVRIEDQSGKKGGLFTKT
jgi:hypothetical protein